MYRFKKGHEDDKIGIKGWKENISQENLTDDVAELLLKHYPDLPIEKGEPLKIVKKTNPVIVGTSKKDVPEGNKPEAKGPSTPAKDSDLN